MYKIYSRKRIRIPNIKFTFNKGVKSKERIRNISKISLILLIAFSIVEITLKSVTPIYETLCEDEAKSIATIIANEQATVVMRQHNYDELFTVEKDSAGNITMIKSNIFPINEITSDIAVKIQEEINKKENDDIEIALRKFYRNSFISRKRSAE